MASSSRINLVWKRPKWEKKKKYSKTELRARIHAAMWFANENGTMIASNQMKPKWSTSILYLTVTVIRIYYTRSVDEMSIKNQLKINTEAWQITAQSISKRQISIIKIIRFKRHIKRVLSTRKRKILQINTGSRICLFCFFLFEMLVRLTDTIKFIESKN